MRRITASTLLLLVAAILAFPFLASAQTQSLLPACCRNHGAHHCTMHMPTDDDSGTGFHPPSLEQSCPYRNLKSGFHSTKAFNLDTSSTISIHHPLTDSPIQQAHAAFRIAAARNHHKRGPPTLPSRSA